MRGYLKNKKFRGIGNKKRRGGSSKGGFRWLPEPDYPYFPVKRIYAGKNGRNRNGNSTKIHTWCGCHPSHKGGYLKRIWQKTTWNDFIEQEIYYMDYQKI